MMPENEGFSCFIHTAEGPLLPLLAVCFARGPAFETANEDRLLTGPRESGICCTIT